MKNIFLYLLLTIVVCITLPVLSMAQTVYVYGFSGITYDTVNQISRGTSYTELDYSTETYYSPYVCGELHTDGVQRVRACGGGIHRATRYTSYASNPNTIYLLSDHYVDIIYYEDPDYIDYYGYGLIESTNFPNSYFYPAPDVYNRVHTESMYLGSTNVTLQRNICGDVRDTIVTMYGNPAYGPPSATPPCRIFVDNVDPVLHFTFNEFNVHQVHPWALINYSLYNGVENVRANNGNVALRMTSGYRTPAHNSGIPGSAINSQHIYGFAADLQTYYNWDEVAWFNLRVAGLNSSACCELVSISTYDHVHVDWRSANPMFRPTCPVTWRTP